VTHVGFADSVVAIFRLFSNS